MKNYLRILFCILVLLICANCYGRDLRSDVVVRFSGGVNIKAQIARSEKERADGLMYRKELSEDRGMVFIFPDEDYRSFWMKNTYIPLDIIFMTKEKKIVKIIESATPLSVTPRLSEMPAKYVLEVVGGKSKELGAVVGVTMEIVEGSL